MFGTRRDRVRSLNALLCQVLRKIVVVLSQYMYHSTFLLVTPIIMSSYKNTIIQCKSTSLWSRAVLS